MLTATLLSDLLSEQLPSSTVRYDDCKAPTGQAATIVSSPIGVRTAQQEDLVPIGWVKLVNPAEGRVYFRNYVLHLVTEAFIQIPEILERVMECYQTVAFLLKPLTIDFELFLNVEVTQEARKGTCSYYLVNYDDHTVFWLRDISTTVLGISGIRNSSHLVHLLEEQFWVHMEYMPRANLDMRGSAHQLLASLATLAIDASTSAGSISPFSPEECKSYSQELKQALDTKIDLEINWCIARIMSLLTHSRIVNLHGELGARTDRSMIVSGQRPPTETPSFRLISFALFSAPSSYLKRWNAIWIDRIIYTREWRRLGKEMTEEWRFSAKMSGLLAITGVGLHTTTASPLAKVLASLATILAISNGAYSMTLSFKYHSLGQHAADGAAFIQAYESASSGLQNLALLCSIPGALVTWSSTFLSLSVIWIILLDIYPLIYSTISISVQQATVGCLIIGAYMCGRGVLTPRRYFY